MEQFISSIGKNKKQWLIVSCCYLIFNGCFGFPVRMGGDKYFSIMSHIIQPIIICLLIAAIFYGLEAKKYLKVFVIVFTCNGIGLLCRIWLEWGESSLMTDLTTLNIIIFILVTPVLTTVFYRGLDSYSK